MDWITLLAKLVINQFKHLPWKSTWTKRWWVRHQLPLAQIFRQQRLFNNLQQRASRSNFSRNSQFNRLLSSSFSLQLYSSPQPSLVFNQHQFSNKLGFSLTNSLSSSPSPSFSSNSLYSNNQLHSSQGLLYLPGSQSMAMWANQLHNCSNKHSPQSSLSWVIKTRCY